MVALNVTIKLLFVQSNENDVLKYSKRSVTTTTINILIISLDFNSNIQRTYCGFDYVFDVRQANAFSTSIMSDRFPHF